MRMYDLIRKKKNGEELTTEEIRYMIEGFTEGEVPDYQMSAMTMAICFRGMSKRETLDLTLAMRDSGDVLDLSAIEGIKVDKHSTGGVGDKTSLALTPIVAALGVPVAKMSGRGLGHTGGTIDKLECFPGFTTEISEETFVKNVNCIGIAIAGQTANLAPADKKLYALRDVTATVDQMSLIASSIMCKKLASGSDAIVLDVKTGNGAFMKRMEDSVALAEEMVSIGTLAGKKTAAVITDMDQPLGYAIGNSLEVAEAIDTLNGHGPKDFKEVVFALGSLMLQFANRAQNEEEAIRLMEGVIADGSARKKLAEFVLAQGGDAAPVFDPSLLPVAKMQMEVIAPTDGYVHRILAEEIGIACMTLGGGRETKESSIDLSVGIVLKKKNGDFVKAGETLAVIHGNELTKMEQARERIVGAYEISSEQIEKKPVICRYVGRHDF
ncbi:MAG: pyrimidine-nucleoside phosphorylase [Roseburia sp.]